MSAALTYLTGPRRPLIALAGMTTALVGALFIFLPGYCPLAWPSPAVVGALLLLIAGWDLITFLRQPHAAASRPLTPISLAELEGLRSRKAGKIYMGEGAPWTPEMARRHYLLSQAGADPSAIPARSRPIFLPHEAFSQHMLTLGTTQCGKTTFNELLSVQAILDGDPVIIINPKEPGRWLNSAYEAALHAGRQDRFHFVSLSFPKASSSYNPLEEFSDATELADRVVIPLPESRDAAPYKAFCHKVMHAVIGAMIYCRIRPTFDKLLKYSLENLGELLRMVLQRKFPEKYLSGSLGANDDIKAAIQWYRDSVAKGLIQEDRVVERLATLFLHPIDNFQRMTNSLVPYLTKLSSDATGKIMGVEAGDVRWVDIAEGKGIVYFDLAGMKGLLSSEAVGRMIVSDLTSFIGARYAYYKSRPRIHLFVDEFSNVLTKEFLDVLNKAAGSGLRVYAMAQSLADPEAVLGSKAHAQRMLDNIRAKVQMQAADDLGATSFSQLCGKTRFQQIEVSMNTRPAFFSAGHRAVADYEQSQSRRESIRTEYLVPPEILQSFDKGEMLLKLGPDLCRIRARPLAPGPIDYLRDVKSVMRI